MRKRAKNNQNQQANNHRSHEGYELQFLVMINTSLSLPTLTRQLHDEFGKAKRQENIALDPSGNLVELRHNEDFHPSLVSDQNEGFLHYRYQLEVTPTASTSLEQQIVFAKSLKDKLESHGHQAVICADFEEMLEEPQAKEVAKGKRS